MSVFLLGLLGFPEPNRLLTKGISAKGIPYFK